MRALEEGAVGHHYAVWDGDGGPGRLLPEGLPKGLAREVAATGQNAALFRACMRDLWARVRAAGGADADAEADGPRNFLVGGPRGAGKSVALACLAAWAPESGWITLYVPSAQAFVKGGVYVEDEATEMWDTPESATGVLRGMMDAHEADLEEVPARVSAGQLGLGEASSLADVVRAGLESHARAVPAALLLCSELLRVTEKPVLVCVDDYNALFGLTDYYEALSVNYAARIPAHYLRMVAAFRWLEHPPLANGAVVCGTSTNVGVRHDLEVPNPRGVAFEIGPYDRDEVDQVVRHYSEAGVFDVPATSRQMLNGLQHLTRGRGASLRELAPSL